MKEYLGTIFFALPITIVFICMTVAYFIEKRKGHNTGWYQVIMWTIFPILFFVTVAIGLAERRDAKYNYDWQYTCKLYYYDGGNEVKAFSCRGFQYPQLVNRYGVSTFACGDSEVRCVTRFDVIKKEKIDGRKRH